MSNKEAPTTVADLLRGIRVELCGRTATILGFTGDEKYHELRVRVDATGEEESWWIGNLTTPTSDISQKRAPIPIVEETRSENNIQIGRTLGKRVTLPESGVLEICWRQPHGAVSFWQLRNHPHIGSRGLNKHGHDFIDDLEAALAEAQQRHDAELAHLKTLKHTLDLIADDVPDIQTHMGEEKRAKLQRVYDRLYSARCQVNELLVAP